MGYLPVRTKYISSSIHCATHPFSSEFKRYALIKREVVVKKKIKDKSIEKKLYVIAEKLSDLNPENKVKCGVQNNFGHATVIKVEPGGNVRFHHMFDNSLSLDLLLSPNAQNNKKYAPKCEIAKSRFLQLFSGKTKENQNFPIPSRKDEPHYRLWVDVTNIDVSEILEMVDNIKKKIA